MPAALAAHMQMTLCHLLRSDWPHSCCRLTFISPISCKGAGYIKRQSGKYRMHSCKVRHASLQSDKTGPVRVTENPMRQNWLLKSCRPKLIRSSEILRSALHAMPKACHAAAHYVRSNQSDLRCIDLTSKGGGLSTDSCATLAWLLIV